MLIKEGDDSKPLGSKKLLGELTHKKNAYLSSKTSITDSELYETVKEFFKEYLDLKYEFTLDELEKELDTMFIVSATKDRTIAFIEKIKVIEYKDKPYSNDELSNMLKEFDEIVTLLIKYSERTDRKGFFSWLFGGKKKEVRPEKKAEAKPEAEEKKKVAEKPMVEKPEMPVEEKEPAPSASEEDDDLFGEQEESPEPEKEEHEEEKPSQDLDGLTEEEKNIIMAADDEDWLSEAELEAKKEGEEESEFVKETEPEEDSEDIGGLLEKTKKYKSKKKLKELYKEILEKYNSMSEEEQEKYYDELEKLYKKIKK